MLLRRAPCTAVVARVVAHATRGRRLCATAGRLQQRGAAASAQLVAPTDACEAPPLSAYVHIPFCRRRCFYCDFPIQVVGDNTKGAAVSAAVDDYVSTLCADIAASAPAAARAPLETVYFGGGTPSLLPPSLLARILDALHRTFGVAADAEVSMEMDPGTFDAASLGAYLSLGVTRVNLGVQSFDAAMLTACGRAHTTTDVAAALDAVRASSVRSWGLDLISGLPGLTRDTWAATLAAAVAARPHHVSVYDLQVEPGTAFGRWYTPGAAPLPSEGEAARMYRAASHALTAAGYEHYEVSNFALPGRRCAHNMRYWRNESWHAFGVAAANQVGGRRFTRPRRLRDYVAWVRAGGEAHDAEAAAAAAAVGAKEALEERLLDTLMLALRVVDGVDVRALRQRYGDAVADAVVGALAPHAPKRATLIGHDGASLAPSAVAAAPRSVHTARLTVPDGFLLSNSVVSDVFARLPAA